LGLDRIVLVAPRVTVGEIVRGTVPFISREPTDFMTLVSSLTPPLPNITIIHGQYAFTIPCLQSQLQWTSWPISFHVVQNRSSASLFFDNTATLAIADKLIARL
jgi:hypothetical protein